MTCLRLLLHFSVLSVLASPLWAQAASTTQGSSRGTVATTATTKIAPATGALRTPLFGGTQILELNGSDCRLDGGTVVVPGDDRCGKLGAPYCRKTNGEAACLTEQ